MTARFIIGDTRDVVASMPDGSVDLVLTSPPFLALRSYLPADHPDKWREIGSEATPAAFLDTMLELTAEWGRVLAPHGTLAVELGDTYAGSGGAGGDYNAGGLRVGQQKFDGSSRRAQPSTHKYAGEWANPGFGDGFKGGNPGGNGWPMAKSKALIPELYRIALAYGINPLTGQPSPAGRWRVRNVVTWCRPNPPVGALGDKFRPATSDMVIACRASDRWFDLDAVRVPLKVPEAATPEGARMNRATAGVANDARPVGAGGASTTKPMMSNPAGGPPLDYWVIPPGGYNGAHYAVYPPELCRIPIEAMCPRQVCTVCGQPRRRIVESKRVAPDGTIITGDFNAANRAHGQGYVGSQGALTTVSGVSGVVTERTTIGWSDCGHESWRRGIVFDPFGGSGTTGVVATGHGRDAILVDLDARNADLASDRIGPLLVQIEDMRTPEQIAAGVLDDPTGPADVLALELDLDEPDPVAESGVVIDLDARRSAGVSS